MGRSPLYQEHVQRLDEFPKILNTIWVGMELRLWVENEEAEIRETTLGPPPVLFRECSLKYGKEIHKPVSTQVYRVADVEDEHFLLSDGGVFSHRIIYFEHPKAQTLTWCLTTQGHVLCFESLRYRKARVVKAEVVM